MDDSTKRCKECEETKPVSDFQRHSARYLRARCKACMKLTVPTEAPPDPKPCSKCGEHKPLSEFWRDKQKKDGYEGLCKDCSRPDLVRSRAKSREVAVRLARGLKQCSACREVKSASEFYIRGGRRNGLTSQCKSCIDTVQKARLATEEGAKKSQATARQWRESHADHCREVAARYYAENRERVDEKNRAWRKRNPTKARALARSASARRRAKKRAAQGEYTPAQEQAMYEFYGHTCLSCGWRGKLTFDHVVPVLKGGHNTILNGQPLCQPCNSRKGIKTTDHRDLARFMTFIDQLKADGLLTEL